MKREYVERPNGVQGLTASKRPASAEKLQLAVINKYRMDDTYEIQSLFESLKRKFKGELMSRRGRHLDIYLTIAKRRIAKASSDNIFNKKVAQEIKSTVLAQFRREF